MECNFSPEAANVHDADPLIGKSVGILFADDNVEKYGGQDLCWKAEDWNVEVSLSFEKSYLLKKIFYLVIDGS
jgi:hypothetical protein